ncbi:MAG: hypothetical protein OQK82_05290 [Candidatus Pacearchaeota archaeon]|nr:hypothetical protein [Candidatus Pacearchaeota archaeon]
MNESITENYRIWYKKDINKLPIERQFDGMLKDYVYYPEEEWSIYNMRPADKYPLIGSWRNKEGSLFIFLFETNHYENEPDYLVYIAGLPDLVKPMSKLIGGHKEILEKIEKRELASKRADESLSSETKKKSLERFAKIAGIFTVIVNAFSLYLRTIPTPSIQNETLKSIYEFMVMLVHFSALSLLILIILFAIAYVIKYGLLMLGRRS